jgi:hypothetical protein
VTKRDWGTVLVAFFRIFINRPGEPSPWLLGHVVLGHGHENGAASPQ